MGLDETIKKIKSLTGTEPFGDGKVPTMYVQAQYSIKDSEEVKLGGIYTSANLSEIPLYFKPGGIISISNPQTMAPLNLPEEAEESDYPSVNNLAELNSLLDYLTSGHVSVEGFSTREHRHDNTQLIVRITLHEETSTDNILISYSYKITGLWEDLRIIIDRENTLISSQPSYKAFMAKKLLEVIYGS